MKPIEQTNYFILTGAMGAGKSTLLEALEKQGLKVIHEPARQILAEQKIIDGDGVPDRDEELFTELLLSRAVYQYQQAQNYQGPVIFDRGVADNIAYADLFDLDIQVAEDAAREYSYNSLVFLTPGWEAIYENDEERKMSFEQANQFGIAVKAVYQKLGYDVIDVPLVSPALRAAFISKKIDEQMFNCAR